MDANECVGDEIGSGYPRDTQTGLANSSPTLRIRSTGLRVRWVPGAVGV